MLVVLFLFVSVRVHKLMAILSGSSVINSLPCRFVCRVWTRNAFAPIRCANILQLAEMKTPTRRRRCGKVHKRGIQQKKETNCESGKRNEIILLNFHAVSNILYMPIRHITYIQMEKFSRNQCSGNSIFTGRHGQ